MGTWGTALFSNDSAADLRDQFQTIVRAPWDGARILDYLLEKFPSGNDPKDEEYTDLRLAIADLFWQYGIDHPASFRLAAEIVVKGADLDSKRALAMSASDVRKRGKVLDELRAKWAKPNPKPRPRKMLKAPEPFLLSAGDCIFYQTSRGNPLNPYVSESGRASYDALYKWKQDGWGTVLVLAAFRRFDVLARYLVAVLDFADAEKPALERFRSLHILHANMGGGAPVTRVHAVHTTASHSNACESRRPGDCRWTTAASPRTSTSRRCPSVTTISAMSRVSSSTLLEMQRSTILSQCICDS